jgi:hypothetical protein
MVTRCQRLAPLALLAVACAVPPPPSSEGPDIGEIDARDLLIRAGLDVRGVRPSIAEYELVEQDPTALDGLLATFVDDAGFEKRVRDIFAPAFRTRIEYEYFIVQADATLSESTGEEPLRLIADIATNDRPYTDVVESQTTLADDTLLGAWPMEEVAPGGGGWREARYTDGRPMAGVLSMSSIVTRFPSAGTNYNRGRANAFSRALLCQDYLLRPVDFPRDVDLSGFLDVQQTIKENVACQACHASLDPFASYFYGFADPGDGSSVVTYSPQLEQLWQQTTQAAPGFFSEPGYTLADLGHQIAADPRFVSCAVKRVYEGLLGRQATIADDGALAEHREAFLAGGLRLKPLFISVLGDAAYRGRTQESRFGATALGVTRKVVLPEILSTQLTALTGYRFDLGGRDALAVDNAGLRSLAGGADGISGTGSADGPTVSMLLVQERLAQAGARAVVDGLAQPAALSRALAGADLSVAPTTASIQALHRTIFGTQVAPDSDEVTEATALWSELLQESGSDPSEAWTGLLSALLRDPELTTY